MAVLVQFFAQGTVLQNQTALHGGMTYYRQQAFGLIGLGQKIKGAIVHGLYGHINIAVAGNQYDGLLGIASMQGLHQRQAIHARHTNIRHHHAGIILGQAAQGLLPAGTGHHFQARQFQTLHHGGTQVRIIINKRDFHSYLSPWPSSLSALRSTIWNVAPPRREGPSSKRPPRAATISCEITSPKPTP